MTGVAIGIGMLIGAFITMLIFRAFIVGKLRIDINETADEPYIFLELDKPPAVSLANKQYVILKVEDKWGLSHE